MAKQYKVTITLTVDEDLKEKILNREDLPNHCWEPTRAFQDEYRAAVHDLSIENPPKLCVHPQLGPFLCLTPKGFRLVIPASHWAQLSKEERDVVLRHELAQISIETSSFLYRS